jgi:2-amino-4-hydroxy-6-hydroxymethyldihydropteridine diphosphokinase
MILIALGSNLPSHAGPPSATLLAACEALAEKNVRVRTMSPLYRTQAWPNPSDPEYVNAVARVETALGPQELMGVLEQMETQFGRKRSAKNAPRTLDLDLIDYDGRRENGPPILPHPRMHDRGFVLVPLADIAPGWRHPTQGTSVEELIAALPEGAAGVVPL